MTVFHNDRGWLQWHYGSRCSENLKPRRCAADNALIRNQGDGCRVGFTEIKGNELWNPDKESSRD
jgi:hypothetical protein